MSRKKQLITIAGSFAVAGGIGYFMQNGEVSASLAETTPVSAEAEAISTSSLLPETPVDPVEIDKSEGVQIAAVQTVAAVEVPEEDIAPKATVAELACETTLTATPTVAAMVTLDLDAPCQKNVRATIHHQGMHFTQLTDVDGKFKIDVPALAEAAIFIVAFPNGEGAVANTTVTSMSFYDRVVLQWKGSEGFDIHAREFGADYGAKGHVWSEAVGDVDDAVTGSGGFMVNLGDQTAPDPLLAQIYSFPTAVSSQTGEVDLTVEAEITTKNCGRALSAETMQVIGGNDATIHALEIEMPDCDASGGFLVLNNMFENLKLAQN